MKNPTVGDLRPGDLLISLNGSWGELVLSIIEDLVEPEYFHITILRLWDVFPHSTTKIHSWNFQYRFTHITDFEIVRT